MRNRMGLRFAALVCITMLTITGAVQGRAAGEGQTPFKFDSVGGWQPLQPVNPYADFTLWDPWDGTAWEGSSVAVTGRAVIVPDVSSAQISVDFVPEAGEIRQSGPDLFIVPLRKPLKWKVTVTVRNPGDVAMTGVAVSAEFGSDFRVTVEGSSDKKARIIGADARGVLPMASVFSWNIGYLGPGDAAKAELGVRLWPIGGGAGFSAEGVYSIHDGFRLTYSVLGQAQSRRTCSHSAIARQDPASFRPDTVDLVKASEPDNTAEPVDPGSASGPGSLRPIVAPTYVDSSTRGGALPQIERLPDPASPTYPLQQGRFRLLATGLTPNISVEDDKFVVAAGEPAAWNVEMWVWNPDGTEPKGWNGWTLTLTFGRHLEPSEMDRWVMIGGVPVSNEGNLTFTTSYPEPGVTIVRVLWDWQQHAANRFLPGSSAYLMLTVITNGLDAGSQDLVFAEEIVMEYNPAGGAFFHSVPLHDIYVKRTGGCADISLSANRLDWLVRKPGTYAATMTQVATSGTGVLLMQFSGFADLARLDGSTGSIPAWYGFGSDMASADAAGWIRAADLNDTSRSIDLSNPAVLTMWSKISVGEYVSSAEYGDEGVITFIIGNNGP